MPLFAYPLALEARIPFVVEAASKYRLQAWELQLPQDANSDQPDCPEGAYCVPEGLGAGYLGIVWDGSVSLIVRDDETRSHEVDSGLGVFLFDQIDQIALGASATSARVAVIGILDMEAPDPSLGLPGRGKCGELPLEMPEIQNDGQIVIAILRQLQFWDETNRTPTPVEPELWPRPGFFLTTIDGPQAGRQCESGTVTSDGDELDLILLPALANATYDMGKGGDAVAYIIDFYAEGDAAPGRGSGGSPAPGCTIRCWGP